MIDRSDRHGDAAKRTYSPVLLVVALIFVAVASGLTVAFLLQPDEGRAPAAAEPISTAATTNRVSTAPRSNPTTTTTAAPDPEAALRDLGARVQARSIAGIAVDDCGDQYAMLDVHGTAELRHWVGGAWTDVSWMLELQNDSVLDQLHAVDLTMDLQDEFVLIFQVPDGGMRGWGGVFGATDCQWGWMPIRDGDDVQEGIDGLWLDPDGTLTASGFAGSAGRKGLYVTYYPERQEFWTEAIDPDQYAEPPAVVTACTRLTEIRDAVASARATPEELYSMVYEASDILYREGRSLSASSLRNVASQRLVMIAPYLVTNVITGYLDVEC